MRLSELTERKQTKAEKNERERLKDKFDKKGLKKDFKKRYGAEEGEQAYFATITKLAKEKA